MKRRRDVVCARSVGRVFSITGVLLDFRLCDWPLRYEPRIAQATVDLSFLLFSQII
jgi:hypothetical protein